MQPDRLGEGGRSRVWRAVRWKAKADAEVRNYCCIVKGYDREPGGLVGRPDGGGARGRALGLGLWCGSSAWVLTLVLALLGGHFGDADPGSDVPTVPARRSRWPPGHVRDGTQPEGAGDAGQLLPTG
jgi:hypothetical protein